VCEARKRLRTWIEGVILASAVTQGVLLDAASHLTWSVASERDDMEGVEDAACVLGAGQAMVFLLSPPWRDLESRSVYRSETVRRARPTKFSCAVPDLPGTRATQAGRGMILPSRQVHDAGELTGPSSASVLVMPHASHQPPVPARLRNGRGHQKQLAGTA